MRAKITAPKNTEALLKRMPIELRGKQLKAATRKAGAVVAVAARKRWRQTLPAAGYPGDKPGKTPLIKTISTVTREKGSMVASFTGPRWPEGAHGHLVEFGFIHVGGVRVEPKPALRPAGKETEQKQRHTMIDTLKKGLKDLARG